MRKRTKRTLILLLALVLCLGLLPTAALAAKTSVTYPPDDNPTLIVNPGAPKPPEYPSGGTVTIEDKTKGDESEDDGPKYTTPSFDHGMWNPSSGPEDPAPEDGYLDGPYWVSFLASGGKFSDGTAGATLLTVEGPDERYLCRVQFPKEDPVREGYVFSGWCYQSDVNFQNPVADPEYVTADSVMCAKWTPAEPSQDEGTPWWLNHDFKLDPNGGTVSPDTFKIDQDGKIIGKLPTPTRPGYTFRGWYVGVKPLDESTFVLGVTTTASFLPVAQWDKDDAKTSFRVDFIPNGGAITSIRGLAARDIVPGSAKAQENKVFVDTKSGVGMMETGEDGRLDSFPEIERGGYTLEGWYIVSGALDSAYAGKEIAIPSSAKKADLTTVFKSRSYLAAKWVKASPETPAKASPEAKFNDVKSDSPFAPAISWAVEQGITNGKTAATFGPGDPCTRAQIVTFLWRAAGSPEPKLTETQYMDVTDPGAYYYKAVQWAAEMDMEYAGTFDPHKTCTRASAVYFIWKAFGSPKAAAKSSFADMPEEPANGGQWYWPDLLNAVDWAVGRGVTNGKTAATFAPAAPCTRGQIVTFLYRAYAK